MKTPRDRWFERDKFHGKVTKLVSGIAEAGSQLRLMPKPIS